MSCRVFVYTLTICNMFCHGCNFKNITDLSHQKQFKSYFIRLLLVCASLFALRQFQLIACEKYICHFIEHCGAIDAFSKYSMYFCAYRAYIVYVIGCYIISQTDASIELTTQNLNAINFSIVRNGCEILDFRIKKRNHARRPLYRSRLVGILFCSCSISLLLVHYLDSAWRFFLIVQIIVLRHIVRLQIHKFILAWLFQI